MKEYRLVAEFGFKDLKELKSFEEATKNFKWREVEHGVMYFKDE